MRKILITGSKSRAASRLSEYFLQHNDADSKTQLLKPDHLELDITNQDAVYQYVSQYRPYCILHFAAITDLKVCEGGRNDKNSFIWKTNVLGTQHLIKACENYDIPFVYISTSLVFSGLPTKPGPYDEHTPTETNQNLLSWYGVTKAAAEQLVQASHIKHFILRFSSTTRARFIEHKPDFLWKIVYNLRENTRIPYFSDQHTTLTDLTELGDVIHTILEMQKSDIFHLSSESTTPAKVAYYLAEKLGYQKTLIQTSTLDSYRKLHTQEKIERFFPQYSGLQSRYTQNTLHIRFKTWKEIVDAFVKENNLQ